MLKIAVIFESSPFDRKGLFNAVHNRIKHLLAAGECQVDAFCIHSWDTALTRKARHTPYIAERSESVEVEGITYRMLWYDFSIMDDILVEKLHHKPYHFTRFMKRCLPLLAGYDCISAHSFAGGLIARAASVEYGTPYYVTWHGSDIHTHPLRNSLKFRDTAEVMKGAACNFFVSGALLNASDKITPEGRKEILYNGVSEAFAKFDDSRRSELRRHYGIEEGDKVVAFVGSIVAVKNVFVLQPLFHEIRSGYEGPLKFWMVGDGKLRKSVEPVMLGDPSLDVRFWGNVPVEEMPLIMNCIDLMVLPSLNEGLPLVCLEALRCGASVIGSDVGGISEVIGGGHVVTLGPEFIQEMASQAVRVLASPSPQPVPEAFDWALTAEREWEFILSAVR